MPLKRRASSRPIPRRPSRGRHTRPSAIADVVRLITPGTTYDDLFEWTNSRISRAGFENLDFARNVGHSIATRREDRQYVVAGNHEKLADVPFFTFEPHVRVSGHRWGFKHENILFFNS